MRDVSIAGLVILIASLSNALAAATADSEPGLRRLEENLERLRTRWNVPGMAAGVARSNQIIWTKGFGYADVAAKRPVTPDTVFHLASLTKPFAAVVLLQLVEAGRLDLDAPVADFGIDLRADGVVRVRHLLTHTSEGRPGEKFRYSGNRFARLDKVLEQVTGSSFAQVVGERILDPLGLTNTSPNPYAPAACVAAHRDPAQFLQRSARGYAFDGQTPVDYPKHFVTAAGLVSTVGDVLRFSMALDGDRLLRPATRQMAFTPAQSPKGKTLPYGLGWFIQQRRRETIVWHYGWDKANSTLIVKVPDRQLTFVLLGNSEALSRKFDLGQDEDVSRSPFAREFLRSAGL
jgi:CubicO group peptidase (beta-lactamase class C family)